MKAIAEGKLVYAYIIKSGFKTNVFLENMLINMHAECGNIEHARQIFEKMLERDIVSWNTMIARYTKIGHGEEALKLFWQMQWEWVRPDNFTFASVLKACANLASLSHGKQIHKLLINSGYGLDVFVGNALIDMYVKCGSLADAWQVFDKIPKPDVVSWTAMITGCTHHRYGEEALRLFQQMQQRYVKPNNITFVSILKACNDLASLEHGKQIHALIIKSGFESDVFIGSALVDMYAKCGSIEQAWKVFAKMPKRNVVSWNTIISACSLYGCNEMALKLFWQMQWGCIKPNNVTFVIVFKACANLVALEQGKQIHACIIDNGFELNAFVGNTLIDMYAKCGSVKDARQVFDRMPEQDVVSWTAMIAGYYHNGHSREALRLFLQMQQQHVKPNNITFVNIMRVCASLFSLENGRVVHACIIGSGFEFDVFVGGGLVDMYTKCGSIEHACQIFNKMPKQNELLWNAMISGYVQYGHDEEALRLFGQMQQVYIKLSNVPFASALKACANLRSLEQGKQIHASVIKSGIESDISVGNALINMYSKCGCIRHARQAFEKLAEQHVVSWNVMITGYCQCGFIDDALKFFQQMQQRNIKPNVVSWTLIIAGYTQLGNGGYALKLFWEMQQQDVKPNIITFISVLKACATLATLEEGRNIHCYIIKNGFESDVLVASTLVDMYAKCGSIEDAYEVFGKMLERDVVTWNAMISGFLQQRRCEDALNLFWQMQKEHVNPNNATFVNVLKACTNLIALEQGKEIHACIIKSGFELDVIVGSTLVDMYAKCGSLMEARLVFEKISDQNVVSWTAMISGYAQHGHGIEALKLFQQMQHECVKPDDITFISILTACSHAGLIDEGYYYFYSMNRDHGITPAGEHCACMVDLFGRAGWLEKAAEFIGKMLFQPTAAVWMALLGACRVHDHVELAKHALECILELEPQNSAGFVLLSNIYGAAGNWSNKLKVRKMMEDRGMKKELGCSCIVVNNQMHGFIVEDMSYPQTREIQPQLK